MPDTIDTLCNCPEDTTAADYVAVPDWIEQDISCHALAAILHGGCASGAYMPAVTYHTANRTMADHGDDVLDYIVDQVGELPKPSDTESWSGMAVFYLSYAVELWASVVGDDIADDIADEIENGEQWDDE